MKNKIIVLVAPSGSGKDAILDELTKKGYSPIISDTSRPIRKGEKEGITYFFKEKKDFLKNIQKNKMVEYRKYNTLVNNIPDIWYYGVSYKAIENIKNKSVLILDLEGLKNLKKKFPKLDITSFYIFVDYDIKRKRLEKRADYNKEETDRREIDDKKKFSPKNLKIVDYQINNNGKLKDAINEIISIMKNEKIKNNFQNSNEIILN